MNVLFADSFYFIARINDHDTYHARALRFTKARPAKLVSSLWVMLEVADAFARMGCRSRVRTFVDAITRNPDCEIVGFEMNIFDEALNIYHRHQDKAWSLTDCTSFVIMRMHGLTEVLTGDKHFEQAGFVPLLK